jgi:flagellar biosynthesis protein FlhF
MKLSELRNFLSSAQPDEVHLVLSMTCSQEAVELAIDRFNNVRADRMIFTKLDEAPHVGMMLNIVRKVNKPVSYLTTGQDVPEDIEDGRGKRLAQLILGSNL